MHAWINSVVALSVAGSSMFILYYGMTVISREALTARWYYWNRKLALFFPSTCISPIECPSY